MMQHYYNHKLHKISEVMSELWKNYLLYKLKVEEMERRAILSSSYLMIG